MIPFNNDTLIIGFIQKTMYDFCDAILIKLVATCRSQRYDHFLFQTDFISAQ